MGRQTLVYMITGFLGSGKTTFLNRVMTGFPRDRKLMILMNEFGEVGIDGALIEGEDLDILEISKGSIFCVCVKTDFIKGLHEIATGIRPDVLMIESTGVANPADLKRDLKLPIFKDRFKLAEQFCLIDAVHFADEYEVFASVEKQIESSTVFIVNKTDLASPEQMSHLRGLIARHHPAPVIFETTYADIPWQRYFPSAADDSAVEAEQTSDVSPEELDRFIDELMLDPQGQMTPPDRLLSAVFVHVSGGRSDFETALGSMPPGVIRGKGLLKLDGAVHLYNQVMERRELLPRTGKQTKEGPLGRLVFIAPPEVMQNLTEWSGSQTALQQESVFDPMKGAA